jgi:hypothetical protein
MRVEVVMTHRRTRKKPAKIAYAHRGMESVGIRRFDASPHACSMVTPARTAGPDLGARRLNMRKRISKTINQPTDV